MMMRLKTVFACILIVAGLALPAAAQNPFAPRAHVNDRAITTFEVQQRALFLELFNTPGDLQAVALDQLINERLQLGAASRLGLAVTEAQIAEGMNEFAGRFGMGTSEFVSVIGQSGIYEESFREFVRAGVAWRLVIRDRYLGRIDVTEADIDRAISIVSLRGTIRVLLNEIILPDTPEIAQEVRQLAEELSRITTISEFEDAAFEFSVAPSGDDRGRIDWIPLPNLPEPLQEVFVTMRPGQVTEPIFLDGAIALFQLRAIEEQPAFAPSEITLDYARVLIPGAGTAAANAEIARLRANADTCSDLAALAPSTPQDRFERFETIQNALPQSVAVELGRLNERAISTNLREGDFVVLLMLCARRPNADLLPSRAQIADTVADDRVGRLADSYLAELRANAHIRIP